MRETPAATAWSSRRRRRPTAARDRFALILDRSLARLNTRYDYRRSGRILAAPDVRFVAAGTFAAWMKAHGKLGGQHKVPRILTGAPHHADLRAHLERAAAACSG